MRLKLLIYSSPYTKTWRSLKLFGTSGNSAELKNQFTAELGSTRPNSAELGWTRLNSVELGWTWLNSAGDILQCWEMVSYLDLSRNFKYVFMVCRIRKLHRIILLTALSVYMASGLILFYRNIWNWKFEARINQFSEKSYIKSDFHIFKKHCNLLVFLIKIFEISRNLKFRKKYV